MALTPGTRLGVYEITALIGEGGMGQVYRATDTTLGRQVAIKILPDAFASDPERLARFEREAKTLASLNHPNIAAIYGFEKSGGACALVMELVEGDDLSQRIARGAIPLDEALPIAKQIAEALEAAHEQGIIHRDLKPANLKVRSDGTVKVLDFGLAKAMEPVSAARVDATNSPTLSIQATMAGVILGTAAYMSPEQAQSRPLDQRSDIFSLGAVLYELVSGRRPFTGGSMVEVLSAVIQDEPAPLNAPGPVRAAVQRCMAKRAADRYPSMAELRAALDAIVDAGANATSRPPSIAVLPFANMSRDPDDEYFSDGLAEELINLLAHVPNLKVTARTSSFAFRGKEQDIRRIAEALGVGTILEGSVRRAGSRIRVTAQLINAEDGYHLWSERYDRELIDVFAIQDEIAQAIAGALQSKLAAKPSRHTPSFPAYEALLKARHHLRTYVPDAHTRAREYCEQAIALDPAYAAPHALLGFIHLHSTTHTGRPLPAVASVIRSEAQRALDLDPFETDPHFLLGAVAAAHDYNWPEAASEFQLAMASPSVPAEAHWAYASFCLEPFGRWEESTAEMRRAVEKDPLSVLWRGVLMAHLVCAGRYEEALQEGRMALDIADNEIHPHLALGEAYLALGRVVEAVASAERAHRNLPQQSMGTGFLAATLIRVGERNRAEALLREMGDSPTPIWGRAWYHLLCSEIEEAARWYEKMIDAREIFAPVYANSLYTRELRASPYWAKLARMMNLPESVA